MGTHLDLKDQLKLNGSSRDSKGQPNIPDMELREEWQDDELPRPLPESSFQSPDEVESPTSDGGRPGPPISLALSGNRTRKRRLVAPALSLTLERSDSAVSDEFTAAALSPSPDEDDLDINLEELETPSDSESFTLNDSMQDLEWEDDLPRMGRREARAANRAAAEQAEMGQLELDRVDSQGRRWRKLHIAGQESLVNMSVLEPYLQVLSHGGYYGDGMNAIIVVSSCYLPDSTIDDYQYVMDNLFRYILGTLDLMVSENYIIVYLCGAVSRSKMPSIKWLRDCYTTIDRRLRKDLKGLFVVHPNWFIKGLITIVRPFLSVKFSRKVRFVRSLQELGTYIPMEHVQIPDCIRQFDEKMNR
ncbi:bcl-2/adenovirus E1B 19 kDa-interacting protein 2-like protein [Paramormyrops kingsleyae]|uniref:BCL2 interacting protein like n=1 Tax=Paramormyrops kingsleyae TaxID=1676925 RepID=A0A3B3SHJ7_9TELE|nr:BCL2/adenovirus E1B 19 kDa protein-interacting protein 2-like [Paramormyrops kingsleyae]XP_023656976.1 BCL2/adenovirus E1B 19 kDa protein-interacting protein 2-like [Paramormyrops kingsleyae]